MLLQFQVVLLVVAFVAAQKCPSGGQIFARGISKEGKIDVVQLHNYFRSKIANGRVHGQPRGVNLKRMYYDDTLGEKAGAVSKTCKLEHVKIHDDRWKRVGQNLYISYNFTKEQKPFQDWNRAVTAWFEEHKYFIYPDKSTNVTAHYTQLVRAQSQYIGCDFIYYYNVHKPKHPYTKLYTCNYGPGKNSMTDPPYEKGRSGCEKLC